MIKGINGTTRVYALIGQPVSHSISPLIQNTISKMMGINNVYVCFDVMPDMLNDCVKGLISLGVKGFNVTMPHKENVMKYVDYLSKSASLTKAVNTVSVENNKVVGYNTDADGFIRSVKTNSNKGVEGNKVLVLGAGGASKAVVSGCLTDGCEKLYIHNRTPGRARVLKDAFPDYHEVIEVIDNVGEVLSYVDVVINTTSAGMHHSPGESPIPDNVRFNSSQRVFDIIYSPPETKFLKQAKAQGALTCNGFSMLFWQAVIAFEIWNNVTVDEVKIKQILDEINMDGMLL